MEVPRAWLALVAGAEREHGANDGYDDAPATRYSWDDTVANHAEVRPGDAIVVWEERGLLGASVIESIEVGAARKRIHRCPECGMGKIQIRRTRVPLYKCYRRDCLHEFDVPRTHEKDVVTYRSKHDRGWVDLAGCLDPRTLRGLTVHPKSQNAFRELRWDDFRAEIQQAELTSPLTVLDAVAAQMAGGHRRAVVRVRVGQATFRRRLLDRFGPVCAFTGPCPPEALEAAHLYSYASIGTHEEHGGLLFRRDLHRLFDVGHLAVEPVTHRIDVARPLLAYDAYRSLHGRELSIVLTGDQDRWFGEHWAEHRSQTPPPRGA